MKSSQWCTPGVLVVDASVAVPLLVDDTATGRAIRDRVRGSELAAPDLLVLEVLSVLRTATRSDQLSERQAQRAVSLLLDLPVAYVAAARLADRVWALRNNVTAYDAAYVALAEALDAPLLTGDRRLASAPTARCAFEVF